MTAQLPNNGFGESLDEWMVFARQDDCLRHMVPSDLRIILGAIKTAENTAKINLKVAQERGAEIERLQTGLLDLFKDHYWDTLEPNREIVMKHVESVLALVAPTIQQIVNTETKS